MNHYLGTCKPAIFKPVNSLFQCARMIFFLKHKSLNNYTAFVFISYVQEFLNLLNMPWFKLVSQQQKNTFLLSGFCKPKDVRDNKKHSLVYETSCRDCDVVYTEDKDTV